MRERPVIEPRFFYTYHYADVVSSVVEDPFEHGVLWHEFFCDGQAAGLAVPYDRDSALHWFIKFVIDRLLYDYTNDEDLERHKAFERIAGKSKSSRASLQPFVLPVERAMLRHSIDAETFREWMGDRKAKLASATPDHVYEYFNDLRLSQAYDDLIEQSAREVFFILFANRQILLQFNSSVANALKGLEDEHYEEVAVHFERRGVLKRASMPEWVRRAVFYRDRGRCVACSVDLTGLVSLASEKNFDHMVPLASGGLNDVTNVQLLCASCNQRKADGVAFTSSTYEDWYSMAERTRDSQVKVQQSTSTRRSGTPRKTPRSSKGTKS